MRVRTRDFAMRSSQELIQAFETTHDTRGPHIRHHRGRGRRSDAAEIRALERPARGDRRAVRRSRAQPENPRLHRIGRHPRPHGQGGRCRRAHHPRRHVVDERGRRAEASDLAADDAALRGRIPADPLDADANRVLRRVQEIQGDRRRRRRRRGAEGAAGAAGEDLQRHVRRMDRIHRQGRPAGCGRSNTTSRT